MNNLRELISKLCPDGVEFKKLGEILEICNGGDYKKFNAGKIPVYGSGGIMTHIDTAIYDKPSVLIPRKGSLKNLFYVETPFWTVDTIFYTKIDLQIAFPKFIYFCLQKEHLEDLNQAGGVPSLTKSVLNEVKIPIPPLEIQSEIVKILDRFTDLSSELISYLKREFILRKKQHKYYRDKLLNFDSNVEFVKLGEICSISKGIQFNKKYMKSSGSYPVINGGIVPSGFIEQFNQSENTITISQGGASAGFVNWIATKFWAGAHCYILKPSDCVIDRYLFHFLKSQEEFFMENQYGAGIPALKKSILESCRIPIPPLEEQKKIVAILDRFDRLCNDLTAGILAEIQARQKQYEFYRDKLLTFTKNF